jgi:hypothetical protein
LEETEVPRRQHNSGVDQTFPVFVKSSFILQSFFFFHIAYSFITWSKSFFHSSGPGASFANNIFILFITLHILFITLCKSSIQVILERDQLLKNERTYQQRILQLEEEVKSVVRQSQELSNENRLLSQKLEAYETKAYGGQCFLCVCVCVFFFYKGLLWKVRTI